MNTEEVSVQLVILFLKVLTVDVQKDVSLS